MGDIGQVVERSWVVEQGQVSETQPPTLTPTGLLMETPAETPAAAPLETPTETPTETPSAAPVEVPAAPSGETPTATLTPSQ